MRLLPASSSGLCGNGVEVTHFHPVPVCSVPCITPWHYPLALPPLALPRSPISTQQLSTQLLSIQQPLFLCAWLQIAFLACMVGLGSV